MPQPSAYEGLWAAVYVVGALLLTLGIGELLWGGRDTAGPPQWWTRLDDTVPEPDPAPRVAVGIGAGGGSQTIDGGPLEDPRPRIPQNPGGPFPLRPDAGAGGPLPAPGGGAAFPPSPLTPAPRYQAVILTPAGKWGSYWEAVARCSHHHATVDAALRCGLESHRPYSVAGTSAQIVGVERVEE